MGVIWRSSSLVCICLLKYRYNDTYRANQRTTGAGGSKTNYHGLHGTGLGYAPGRNLFIIILFLSVSGPPTYLLSQLGAIPHQYANTKAWL